MFMNESKIILKYVPIFSELDDSILSRIEELGVTRNYKKDMMIMDENNGNASGLFIITKGSVKVTRNDAEGREIILTILGEYEYFGEMSLLDGENPSANVTAMEDSELFYIGREQFMQLIEYKPKITYALLEGLIRRLRAADDKIKSLSLLKAEGKIMSAIIQLAELSGIMKQGLVEVDLPFQHDIANIAGTSRETVSRVLHSLEKKGMIELDGSKIRIPDYNNFKKSFG
jgi:CRP/FNR family transcriptional regulator, cyclic AMP receptor protein